MQMMEIIKNVTVAILIMATKQQNHFTEKCVPKLQKEKLVYK